MIPTSQVRRVFWGRVTRLVILEHSGTQPPALADVFLAVSDSRRPRLAWRGAGPVTDSPPSTARRWPWPEHPSVCPGRGLSCWPLGALQRKAPRWRAGQVIMSSSVAWGATPRHFTSAGRRQQRLPGSHLEEPPAVAASFVTESVPAVGNTARHWSTFWYGSAGNPPVRRRRRHLPMPMCASSRSRRAALESPRGSERRGSPAG